MKIAIAARNLRGKTGVSAIVLEQIRRFAARGDNIDVIGEKLDSALIKEAGGRPVRLRRLPGPRYAARRYFSWRVDRLAARNQYDLVIGNSEILHQDVLFMHNLTHMEHERVPGQSGSGLQSKMRFDESLFRQGSFRKCIANSEFTRQDLIHRHRLDPNKVEVIYPGFNPQSFSVNQRAEIRARVRPGLCRDDIILIGFITSGHYAKRGAEIMVETLSGLSDNARNRIKILAVGSTQNTTILEGMLQKNGLDSLLVAREKTSNIADYYHATDLLFYPALMEEFGLVVIEAAACGTPVLTSKTVGAAELFDSHADFLTATPDAITFTPALESLINEPLKLKQLAEAQTKAVSGNTWERYFKSVFELYDQLQ